MEGYSLGTAKCFSLSYNVHIVFIPYSYSSLSVAYLSAVLDTPSRSCCKMEYSL